jgi:hypothetical protein
VAKLEQAWCSPLVTGVGLRVGDVAVLNLGRVSTALAPEEEVVTAWEIVAVTAAVSDRGGRIRSKRCLATVSVPGQWLRRWGRGREPGLGGRSCRPRLQVNEYFVVQSE